MARTRDLMRLAAEQIIARLLLRRELHLARKHRIAGLLFNKAAEDNGRDSGHALSRCHK
jgi:hypothetical protein